MSLSGVIRGKSPTDSAILLHHLTDDASTAILFVLRIKKAAVGRVTHD
jgi:hypothetical protein